MASDILVVDDETDIRELISGILEDEGHSTRLAKDSDETLQAIEERRPSLVILDIWLQGSKLDGLELLNPGDYLVTDWAAGALYRVDAKGKVTQLIDLNQGSADLTAFPDKKTVLIPMMLDNTLAAYKLE